MRQKENTLSPPASGQVRLLIRFEEAAGPEGMGRHGVAKVQDVPPAMCDTVGGQSTAQSLLDREAVREQGPIDVSSYATRTSGKYM